MVNNDETTLGSLGLTRIGGIFKNSKGFVKGCFLVSFVEVCAFEAELMAVMNSLKCVKVLFWNYLWLESDSMYVVNILSSHLVLALRDIMLVGRNVWILFQTLSFGFLTFIGKEIGCRFAFYQCIGYFSHSLVVCYTSVLCCSSS